MPEIDGYEALRLLAAAEDLAAIPVVILTGFPPARIDQARLGHARAVLAKDHLSVDDLARALEIIPPEADPA